MTVAILRTRWRGSEFRFDSTGSYLPGASVTNAGGGIVDAKASDVWPGLIGQGRTRYELR